MVELSHGASASFPFFYDFPLYIRHPVRRFVKKENCAKRRSGGGRRKEQDRSIAIAGFAFLFAGLKEPFSRT